VLRASKKRNGVCMEDRFTSSEQQTSLTKIPVRERCSAHSGRVGFENSRNQRVCRKTHMEHSRTLIWNTSDPLWNGSDPIRTPSEE
jgi:hypothetical protein